MFDADPRPLPFPLGEPASVESPSYGGDFLCQVPEFPEDSDEKITVLFRLSLNDFVKIATAVDVGSDIAYGEDGITLWELWSLAYMCASFCEEMSICLTDENSAVVEALSNLIQNNLTIQNAISSAIQQQGGAVPGQPLTPTQAETDTLPENVRDEFGDCNFDALWGACLYLVQSGNRAITDFFEQIEAVSNTLETASIVSQTIPAAGAYVSAATEFADQLQENIAEGYAGAYTETYETELACALFCVAQANCELTPDMLMTVMAERLGYIEGTENFGTVMARIGEGVFIGSQIADSAFYIYFTALRFGQQFGSVLGFRPLTDLMGLGADFLASDNWVLLCECAALEAQNVGIIGSCGEGIKSFVTFEQGVPFEMEAYEQSVNVGSYIIALNLPPGNWNVELNSITGTITPPPDTSETAYAWYDTSGSFHNVLWNAPGSPADFSNEDTSRHAFAPWCAAATWNVALFNQAPFSATFTVTAV